jgi:hypothetical protein
LSGNSDAAQVDLDARRDTLRFHIRRQDSRPRDPLPTTFSVPLKCRTGALWNGNPFLGEPTMKTIKKILLLGAALLAMASLSGCVVISCEEHVCRTSPTVIRTQAYEILTEAHLPSL